LIILSLGKNAPFASHISAQRGICGTGASKTPRVDFMMESVSTSFPIACCKQAFSLDGAHLKGAFNGMILTITTTDANNK